MTAIVTRGVRTARAEARILRATLDELAAHGFAGLTVEGVAAAAGVGRATIYRHWGTRAALVMAAARSVTSGCSAPDTGSLRGDLVAKAADLAEALATTPLGSLLPVLLEAAQRDPELAVLHDALVGERRADCLMRIDQAVERGELAPETDRELLLDLTVGPLFYRHLVLHRRTSRAQVEAIVDAAVGSVRS